VMCSFTVTVNDMEAPMITCPANITTNAASDQTSQVVNFSVALSDNCSGATAICSPPSGSSFALGSTPVNCTATDASGNMASCSFMVTVQGTASGPSVTTSKAVWTPGATIVATL